MDRTATGQAPHRRNSSQFAGTDRAYAPPLFAVRVHLRMTEEICTAGRVGTSGTRSADERPAPSGALAAVAVHNEMHRAGGAFVRLPD